MDLRADFLVIGSGIAGLRAALTLAESGDVVVRNAQAMHDAIGRLEAWHAAVRASRQPAAGPREFMRVRSIVRVGLMIATALRGKPRRPLSLGFSESRRHRMAKARLGSAHDLSPES